MTGRWEKPTNAPIERDGSGPAREPDRDGEELEDDQCEPDDEQEVRDRRTRERMDGLADEVELPEPDVELRLATPVRTSVDDPGSVHLDGPERGRQRLTVECNQEVADGCAAGRGIAGGVGRRRRAAAASPLSARP